MNITMQLKKLHKEKREQDVALKEISRKLDVLINEISRLKVQGGTQVLKNKTVSPSPSKLYIPEVDIEGMEVKAGVKEIDNTKDIVGNIDKLNKLGADK